MHILEMQLKERMFGFGPFGSSKF